MGDISSDDFSTPRKSKRHFKLAKEQILKQQKKIKTLQSTVRRLKAKITSLNALLALLREKMYITESSESTIRVSQNVYNSGRHLVQKYMDRSVDYYYTAGELYEINSHSLNIVDNNKNYHYRMH